MRRLAAKLSNPNLLNTAPAEGTDANPARVAASYSGLTPFRSSADPKATESSGKARLKTSKSMQRIRNLFHLGAKADPMPAAVPPLSPVLPPTGAATAEVWPSSSVLDIELDCEIPDKALHPAAAQQALRVFNDPFVARKVLHPKDASAAAAMLVQPMLQRAGFEPQARSVLMWRDSADRAPSNHVVITVSIDNCMYVVDPTAERFGIRPMFVSDDEWKRKLAAANPKLAMVYNDYPNVTRAESLAGSFYDGHVQSFSGGTIMNKPDWYAAIRANPDQYLEVMKATEGRDL